MPISRSPAPHPHPQALRWHWLLPLLVFALLGAATLTAWRWQTEMTANARRESEVRASAAHTAEIRDLFRLQAQFLHSLQAFASANPALDAAAWQRFTREVNIARNLAGLYAFAYAPAVNRQNRGKLPAPQGGTPGPDRIYPAPQQSLSLPIAFIAPDTPELRHVVGFDLLSEEVRRAAIDMAIASHDIALSGRVVLITDRASQRASFHLIQAVYRPGLPLNNVTERRRAFAGIVLCAYHIDDFLGTLNHDWRRQFRLQIYDDGSNDRPSAPQAPELLFDSHPGQPGADDSARLHHEIDFGGRNWILHYSPRPAEAHDGGVDTASLILYGGLLGSALLALLVFHQSTHRARAERYAKRITAELQRSEERLRLANAGSNDGLWDQDLSNGEEYLSPRLGEIFGFVPGQAAATIKTCLECIHPDDRARHRAAIRHHFRDRQPFDVELRIARADGSTGWVRIRGEAVRNAAGRPVRIAGSVSDISERKHFETALQAADHLKQSVLDAATEIAIIACRPDGVISVFNRGAEKMLGYSASEMIGRATPLRIHHPAEVAERAQQLREQFDSPVEGFATFIAIARVQESEQREWTYIRKDGQHLTVSLTVTIQRDDTGQASGYLGIAIDISRRKAAEQELRLHREHLQELVEQRTALLDQALHEAQAANIAKSEFLANMSHELRTPMHAILSFSELGQDRAEASNHDKLAQYFKRIAQSAQRLLGLINDLLDLAKLEAGRSELTLVRCDLRQLVRQAGSQLESLFLARRQSLDIECATVETVLCDPQRIAQVIHNLLANAIKFSPPESAIKIELCDAELPSGEPGASGQNRPAIALRCSDRGVGIPPDELESIFAKFVQSRATKTGAGGSGLGLAISREIVALHRGTIVAANNPGGGACFTVTLPLNPRTEQSGQHE